MQRGLRVITLHGGNREKSNIANAILEIRMIGWHHNYFVNLVVEIISSPTVMLIILS